MKFQPLVLDVGRYEMEEYLFAKFPVFVALVDGEYAGYVVCRIESEVVWVESIFTKEEYRLQGVATALHSKAEKIAASYLLGLKSGPAVVCRTFLGMGESGLAGAYGRGAIQLMVDNFDFIFRQKTSDKSKR